MFNSTLCNLFWMILARTMLNKASAMSAGVFVYQVTAFADDAHNDAPDALQSLYSLRIVKSENKGNPPPKCAFTGLSETLNFRLDSWTCRFVIFGDRCEVIYCGKAFFKTLGATVVSWVKEGKTVMLCNFVLEKYCTSYLR